MTVNTRDDKTLEATRDFGRARENSRRFARRQAQPIVTPGEPHGGLDVDAPLLSLWTLLMTFARHGQLKPLQGKPWILAALLSKGVALLEHLLTVPANRIG